MTTPIPSANPSRVVSGLASLLLVLWGLASPVAQAQTPRIDIEKATNGQDADQAPGPQLQVGDAVEWTYVVRNTGDVALENIGVSDDQGVAVSCPSDTLQPGQSMTCTGSGTAIAGQYSNFGTATGLSPEGTSLRHRVRPGRRDRRPGLERQRGFWPRPIDAGAATRRGGRHASDRGSAQETAGERVES